MAQSYLREGMADAPATFSLFCRRLAPGWGYLVSAGLDDVIDALEALRYDEEDLDHLERTGLFGADLLERLRRVRFTGSVRAMPEGTPFTAGEPVLEVSGPLLEAQLAETVVLNRMHLASLAAGKAARIVDAAAGRGLIDFAMRRAHGVESALRVARGAWIAGFDATSDVLAGRRYGIPLAGTMAHSYVQAFRDEATAFEAFVRAYPDGATLLVDTYDTPAGVRRAARVARALAMRGGRVGAVRLDSGDLDALSRRARAILDRAGLPGVRIVASGGLDEHAIARLVAAAAPIDVFGVGSRLGAPPDAPALDMAYKLTEVDGRPVMKLSSGKATLPGAKQVWRPAGGGPDVVALRGEPGPPRARPLLHEHVRDGRATVRPTAATARARFAAERALLPPSARGLAARPLEVTISPALGALRDEAGAEARRRNPA